MHRGQQASSGQALAELRLEVGLVHFPGAGALIAITMAPSGAQNHTDGSLSVQSFLLPFIPIKYLSLNVCPCVGLRTLRIACVCVSCLQFLPFA